MLLYNGTWFGSVDWSAIGYWMMWIASALTVWSMVVYLKQAWPVMKGDL
jgi:phosphatidylglycerophosphate synthase